MEQRPKKFGEKATSLFYHIHQVAALNAKLVLDGAFVTHFLVGRGGRRGQWWYH